MGAVTFRVGLIRLSTASSSRIEQKYTSPNHVTPKTLENNPHFSPIHKFTTMASTFRICMLNADVPVPNVLANRAPTYGTIFHTLLAASSPDIKVQSTDFNVMIGEYPSSLTDFDAIIISGSANSAYDNEPWIHKLDAYILDVYTNYPNIKIFGSCFGHQIICQSLLREHGVSVAVDPQGWEIGVKEVMLHPRFVEAFGGYEGVGKMCLQFVHHDHVVVPDWEVVPRTWMTVGSTEHCAVQGVYEKGRVLTLQGHFEFDRFVNSECVKFFFGAIWVSEKVEEALRDIDADDDSIVAARMIMRFFLEDGDERENLTHEVVGGLLTPPTEA
jgi:GMP synthase-like glutamine amidotransferase